MYDKCLFYKKMCRNSVRTSFYWRHKFLDVIRVYIGIVVNVGGVKGSRRSKNEKRKIGVSKEQVCVLCAIDRVGKIRKPFISVGTYLSL
ncbi:hypothetical protein CLFE_006070 [Clostridium felsineum DSM 794]|nr:hypothetical protein CLFE_006070 [Clostridium felsineum DSM 794]